MSIATTRLSRLLAATVFILVSGMLAGCGGDSTSTSTPDPEQAALEATSAKIVAGVRAKDPGALCDLFQPSLIKPAFGGRAGCIRFSKRAVAKDSPLATLDVDKVTVRGNGAFVTYKQDPPGQVLFVKENGRWYVSLSELVKAGRQAQKSGSGK